MELQELIKGIEVVKILGDMTSLDITGVNIDSRLIKDGHLFIAMRGT